MVADRVFFDVIYPRWSTANIGLWAYGDGTCAASSSEWCKDNQLPLVVQVAEKKSGRGIEGIRPPTPKTIGKFLGKETRYLG